jgi:hypothetical protein
MKMRCFFVIVLLVSFSINGNTQEPPVVYKFDNTFSLKFLLEKNILFFQQYSHDYEFNTNRPLDAGIKLGYKDISFGFVISIPFIYDRNYSKSPSFDMTLNHFYEDSAYFEGYIKYYNRFHNDDDYEIDLTILTIGVSGEYIFNKNHSIRSVYNLDRKQAVSNGSFLLGGGLFFSSIYSDNTFIDYFDKEKTFYLGPNCGYSYTWILKRGIFVNLLITFGINCMINDNSFSVGVQSSPKISCGYHGKTWSTHFYLNGYLLSSDQSSDRETRLDYGLSALKCGIAFLKRF